MNSRTPVLKPAARRWIVLAGLATLALTTLAFTFLLNFSSMSTENGDSSSAAEREDILFNINATSLTGDGQWITATWVVLESDVTEGSGNYVCDRYAICTTTSTNLWVGVFPASANFTVIGPKNWPTSSAPWLATFPIMWKTLSQSMGQVELFIERQREDQLIVLFGNGTTYPRMLSSPVLVTFDSSGVPSHVHIARTSRVDEMRVMWSSKYADPAVVRWGFEPNNYPYVAAASCFTYGRDDLCGAPATTVGWMDPGYLFSAVISGVEEGQYAYYIVGNDEHGWSLESRFRGLTRPNRNAVLNITTVADMGLAYIDGSLCHMGDPASLETTAGMEMAWDDQRTPLPDFSYDDFRSYSSYPLFHTARPLTSAAQETLDRTDIIFHIGDISYATGYGSKWDRFLKQIERLASRIPYMTGQGNHERNFPGSHDYYQSTDSGGECGKPHVARFVMPTPLPQSEVAGAAGMWYSFDQGPVHFVMMDTEMPLSVGTPQYAFLENDLLSVDRSVTPWIIFMGHRPMYWNSEIDVHFQELEPLLFQAQVDLCLWGHVHHTQISCPVYNGTCVNATISPNSTYIAPIHAVIGNAGHELSPLPPPRADWVVYQDDQYYGYSTIQARGAAELEMKLFASGTNQLLYEFVIVKESV